MITIFLATINVLDINYENVINFLNLEQQLNYFNRFTVTHVTQNIRYDSSLSMITVNKNISELDKVNYLFFKDPNGKYYFYFVTDKQIKNEQNTMLYVKLDVFSTYQFDVTYYDSFVDRCHVDRWVEGFPTLNTIDEGLDMGEIEQLGDPIKICDFNDSVIITATVPIGKLPNSGGGGGGGGTGD